MTGSGDLLRHYALIIDDNWYNRDLFEMALLNANYEVAQADNGVTGITMLQTQKFHLLVLDLHMPDMDGYEVLKTIRSQPKYNHMKILVVTANAHLATDSVYDASDYVMLKPIDVMEFARFAERLKKTYQAQ